MRLTSLAAVGCTLLAVTLSRCTSNQLATGLENGPHSLTTEPQELSVEEGKSADVTVHIFDGVNHEISATQWLPGCSVKAEPGGIVEVSVVGGKVHVSGVSHGQATVTITCSAHVTTSFTVDVHSPTPTISGVSPNPMVKGKTTSITLTGTGFTSNTVAQIDHFELPVRDVNPAGTEATVDLSDALFNAAVQNGVFSLPVQAHNPPDGILSEIFTLPLVYGVPEPLFLNPSSAPAGSPDLQIAVAARAVTPASIVRWQGTNLATTWPTNPFFFTRAIIPAALLTTPGIYQITVFNPTPGGGTSTSLPFTVTATARARFDFTGYEPSLEVAMAAQGSGPFVQVPIVGKVVEFDVTAPVASFAFVTSTQVALRGSNLLAGGGRPAVTTFYQVTVLQLTQQEMAGTHLMGFRFGTTPLSGTVSGVGAGQLAQLLWGNAEATTSGAFSMTNSTPGPHALAGYRRATTGISAADRVFMRQNQASASGINVDFNGAESMPVATATATLSGLIAGDNAFGLMGYSTEPTCEGTRFYSTPATAAHLVTGMPASLQGANDVHIYTIVITNGSTNLQQTFYSKALLPFAASRPPVPATPAVTNVGGAPYQIKQAVVDLGSYDTGTLFYSNFSVTASKGFLGGATGTIRAPDLSGAAGWNSAYAPATTANWSFGVNSSVTAAVGPTCASGSVVTSGSISGSN
jgi:hypothetical protein